MDIAIKIAKDSPAPKACPLGLNTHGFNDSNFGLSGDSDCGGIDATERIFACPAKTIPCVTPECHVLDALYEMSSKGLEMTLVTTSHTKVL